MLPCATAQRSTLDVQSSSPQIQGISSNLRPASGSAALLILPDVPLFHSQKRPGTNISPQQQQQQQAYNDTPTRFPDEQNTSATGVVADDRRGVLTKRNIFYPFPCGSRTRFSGFDSSSELRDWIVYSKQVSRRRLTALFFSLLLLDSDSYKRSISLMNLLSFSR